MTKPPYLALFLETAMRTDMRHELFTDKADRSTICEVVDIKDEVNRVVMDSTWAVVRDALFPSGWPHRRGEVLP